MGRRSGLGRGLDALIPATEPQLGGTARVPVTAIVPNPMQPRTSRDQEALEELAKVDGQLALIVELRFFGGMTNAEVAEALGIGERTVKKKWTATRLWLRRYLAENLGETADQESL